jgi:hypothetical protein
MTNRNIFRPVGVPTRLDAGVEERLAERNDRDYCPALAQLTIAYALGLPLRIWSAGRGVFRRRRTIPLGPARRAPKAASVG